MSEAFKNWVAEKRPEMAYLLDINQSDMTEEQLHLLGDLECDYQEDDCVDSRIYADPYWSQPWR
jgi:hypothetical protein